MPTITLTLTDTPTGSVSVHSDFKPAVGLPISPAQAHALEVINRTHKQWAINPGHSTLQPKNTEHHTQ